MMLPAADSVSSSSTPLRPFLPSLPKRESLLLRQEIAALEQHSPIQEDALHKRWKVFEKDVAQAQRNQSMGFLEDERLRQAEEVLKGVTFCSKQGRTGRCLFVDGKCKHCGRLEAIFKQSFSIQAWRDQEAHLWEEQKERDRAAMEAKFRQQQQEIQTQWDQLATAKANFTFEREQVMLMMQKERELIRAQLKDLERERHELRLLHEQHEELKMKLQAELEAQLTVEREQLKEEQLKLTQDAEQHLRELMERDQQCQLAFLQFQDEKRAWEVEKQAAIQEMESLKETLTIDVHKLQADQRRLCGDKSQLEEQVLNFSDSRQEHANSIQKYRVQCQQWVEEERMRLQHQRVNEQQLFKAYTALYQLPHLQELGRAREEATQAALADGAFVPGTYPPPSATPLVSATLLSRNIASSSAASPSSCAYSATLGPPFPSIP